MIIENAFFTQGGRSARRRRKLYPSRMYNQCTLSALRKLSHYYKTGLETRFGYNPLQQVDKTKQNAECKTHEALCRPDITAVAFSVKYKQESEGCTLLNTHRTHMPRPRPRPRGIGPPRAPPRPKDTVYMGCDKNTNHKRTSTNLHASSPCTSRWLAIRSCLMIHHAPRPPGPAWAPLALRPASRALFCSSFTTSSS